MNPEARERAFPIVHDEYAKIGYRHDWTGFPVLSSRDGIQHLEPYDDIVAVQEAGNTVTVLEANTGGRRWSDQLTGPLTKFVGIRREGDRLFVSSEAELFILDVKTGRITARQRFEKIVATAPVRVGGVLVYGTAVGELLGHLFQTTVDGVKAWGFAVPGAIEAEPVLVGGAVAAVSQAGHVLFVDGATGSLVGRNRIYRGVSTNPVADPEQGIVYIASLDQSLYAFSADGGGLLWKHGAANPLRQQPTFHAGRLYCGIEGQGLVAFDGSTGAIVWTARGVSGEVIGTSRGRLLVWSGSEAILLDAQRGDVIERASLGGVRSIVPDRFDDGNLYIASTSGVVAKFRPIQ
jgi:outer membrane protein assembly factor BamB